VISAPKATKNPEFSERSSLEACSKRQGQLSHLPPEIAADKRGKKEASASSEANATSI